jgi:hypothetical protein
MIKKMKMTKTRVLSHVWLVRNTEKVPTTLIAIPEFHAHEEAAHLVSQEPTLRQQVLEEAYALPPHCTWENEWSPPFSETLQDLTWSEEVEKNQESVQLVQEGQKYLTM